MKELGINIYSLLNEPDQDDYDKLIALAYTFCRFGKIHPFIDGNGHVQLRCSPSWRQSSDTRCRRALPFIRGPSTACLRPPWNSLGGRRQTRSRKSWALSPNISPSSSMGLSMPRASMARSRRPTHREGAPRTGEPDNDVTSRWVGLHEYRAERCNVLSTSRWSALSERYGCRSVRSSPGRLLRAFGNDQLSGQGSSLLSGRPLPLRHRLDAIYHHADR